MRRNTGSPTTSGSPKGNRNIVVPSVNTSADVVREARIWSAFQTVQTERPSTPKDSTRRLFGNDLPARTSRPPSAFSIGPHQFDPNDPSSRPSTGKKPHPPKLSPLDHVPVINKDNLESNSAAGKMPKPLMISKAELDLKKSRNRIAMRRNLKQPSAVTPIKARHDHVPAPPRHVHSAGNVTIDHEPIAMQQSESQSLGDSNERSHSASTINVDLAALVNPNLHKDGNISSSSSASSVDRLSCRSKSGSRSSETKEEPETADQALYWNQNVLPLLEKLEITGAALPDIHRSCLRLYDVLEKGNCMSSMSSRRRTSLLSTLFKLLTKKSSQISLACARIILAVKVRKVNFVSISKVIFKISREEGNDHLFLEHNLVEIVVNLFDSMTNLIEKYEAVIYLVGSIKIWSQSNDLLAKKLVECNTIGIFMNLCANLVEKIDKADVDKKMLRLTADIMVQITSTLRNLAELDKDKFVNRRFFTNLNLIFMLLSFDENVVLNVSRIFSKFTQYSEVVNSLFASEKWEIKYILNAVYQHLKSPDIVTRLCFVLSNIASKNYNARQRIYFAQEQKSDSKSTWCLKILNKVFENYISQLVEREKMKVASEVLNKLISVIANLSINEEIGTSIACNKVCILYMIKVLELTDCDTNEELIANTLTTFNNLSYYNTANSYIAKLQVEVTKHLFNFIICDNMTCVAESIKVFGNLSQYQDVKQLLKENKGDEIMVTLLDSNSSQIVYSACGVLINITTNPANRVSLIQQGIMGKLLDILKELVPLEWRVGGVVCQLMWNMVNEIAINSSTEEIELLITILDVYLQENAPQNILDTSSWTHDMLDLNLSSWEEYFKPFAARLIEKLSKHHAHLEPLEATGE